MAQTVNITIDQGSDFSRTFDLSKLAPTANVANAVAFATMITEYDEPNTAISFSTSLSGANLTISMTHTISANLTPGTWVYDAVLSNANVVTRVVEGRVHVTPAVTEL